MGGRHSTEVAFALLTQPSWFRFSHLTAGKNRTQKLLLWEPAVLKFIRCQCTQSKNLKKYFDGTFFQTSWHFFQFGSFCHLCSSQSCGRDIKGIKIQSQIFSFCNSFQNLPRNWALLLFVHSVDAVAIVWEVPTWSSQGFESRPLIFYLDRATIHDLRISWRILIRLAWFLAQLPGKSNLLLIRSTF